MAWFNSPNNPYVRGSKNWFDWEKENGTNPFQEGTDLANEWNTLNPQAVKRANAAAAVAPLDAASPSFWSPEYGGIPAAASPVTSAAGAIAGNQANLPAIEGLAQGVNQFNLGQQIGQYETALPGYGGMVAQSAQNIGSRLKGELPTDVVRQLTDQAAARGIALGLPGSPFSNAELVRSLGLTSLGLQTQAENELTQAIGRTPTVPLFNTAGFFVSPQEQQQAQQQANTLAAAPVPAKAQQSSLNSAIAGLQAGQAAIPTPQAVTTPQATNSYSLVSDILNRYSQPAVQQVQQQQAPQVTSIVNSPAPSYDIFNVPEAGSTDWNFGYELPAFMSPGGSSDFNFDNFGYWG